MTNFKPKGHHNEENSEHDQNAWKPQVSDLEVNLQMYFPSSFYELISWVFYENGLMPKNLVNDKSLLIQLM